MNKDELHETVDKQKINALILDLDNRNIPLCNAISYQVEYITSDGQRKIFINESKTGSFSDALRGVIQDSSKLETFTFSIKFNQTVRQLYSTRFNTDQKIILFFCFCVHTFNFSSIK